MPSCPTCSSPIQSQWKICATCGNQLTTFTDNEQFKAAPKSKRPIFLASLIGGTALVVTALIFVTPSFFGGLPAANSNNESPDVNESEESSAVESSAAQTIETRLINANICTSAWSREDYEKSPSFNISPAFWDSGVIRVCQVDRTSKTTTRWITIITGSSLLQDFGQSWALPYGSVAIHSDEWTLATDKLVTAESVDQDPVVQAILTELGGTYSESSK